MAFACFGTGPGAQGAERTAARRPTRLPRRPRARRASPPGRRAPRPGEYSILVDAEDSCAARLAGELVAALRADGAKGRVIAGRTSPAALAEAVKSDGADLALAPMDALVGGGKATADWRERAPYIARLGAETDRNHRAAGDRRHPPARRPRSRFRRRRRRRRGHRRDAVLASWRRAADPPSRRSDRRSPIWRPAGSPPSSRSAPNRRRRLAEFGKDGRFHVVRNSVDAGAADALRAGALDGQGPAEPHRRRGKDRHARRADGAHRARRRARPRRAPSSRRR